MNEFHAYKAVSRNWRAICDEKSFCNGFKSIFPFFKQEDPNDDYTRLKNYWNDLIKEASRWKTPELVISYKKISGLLGRIKFMQEWCDVHNLEALFRKKYISPESSMKIYQSLSLTEKLDYMRGNLGSYVSPSMIRLSSIDYLDLSSHISSLPPEIMNFKGLEELWLEKNQLQYLPPEIGDLTNLRSLYLARNHLKILPPEIGKLKMLIRLDLWGNQLRSLPREIGELTNLERLFLVQNQLQTLPKDIEKLTNLEVFKHCCNPADLSTFFPEKGLEKDLQCLYHNYNQHF